MAATLTFERQANPDPTVPSAPALVRWMLSAAVLTLASAALPPVAGRDDELPPEWFKFPPI